MKIGIDAKWYFTGNPSGKIVVRNLLEELLKIDNDDYFYIYLDRKDKNLLFPYKSDKIKIVYIWAGVNALSNIFIIPLISWKNKLDVVLFQYFTPFFSNFRKIAYIHDCKFRSNPEYYTFAERLYFFPLRILLKWSDLIVTVSETERRRIEQYYKVNTNLVKVIYNGVSNKFKPISQFSKDFIEKIKKENELPDNYILYVGRLNIIKNISGLIKAIYFLQNKEISLIVVGEKDWKFKKVGKLIYSLKLEERIKFLGFKEDKELACIYALSTVFCFPSFAESFGMPAVEAMAAGVPVVVSDIPSIQEVCGNAGIYCNPNNPKDIAEKIDFLLSNENIRKEKIALGYKTSEKYKWENSARRILDMFHNLD